jgi:hypothetical protein
MLEVTIMTTALHKQEVLSVNYFNSDIEAGTFIKTQYDADNTITWNVEEIEENNDTYEIYRFKDSKGKTRAKFTAVYNSGQLVDIIDSTATEQQIYDVIDGGQMFSGSYSVTVEYKD